MIVGSVIYTFVGDRGNEFIIEEGVEKEGIQEVEEITTSVFTSFLRTDLYEDEKNTSEYAIKDIEAAIIEAENILDEASRDSNADMTDAFARADMVMEDAKAGISPFLDEEKIAEFEATWEEKKREIESKYVTK